jgi:hypothetical protein
VHPLGDLRLPLTRCAPVAHRLLFEPQGNLRSLRKGASRLGLRAATIRARSFRFRGFRGRFTLPSRQPRFASSPRACLSDLPASFGTTQCCGCAVAPPPGPVGVPGFSMAAPHSCSADANVGRAGALRVHGIALVGGRDRRGARGLWDRADNARRAAGRIRRERPTRRRAAEERSRRISAEGHQAACDRIGDFLDRSLLHSNASEGGTPGSDQATRPRCCPPSTDMSRPWPDRAAAGDS